MVCFGSVSAGTSKFLLNTKSARTLSFAVSPGKMKNLAGKIINELYIVFIDSYIPGQRIVKVFLEIKQIQSGRTIYYTPQRNGYHPGPIRHIRLKGPSFCSSNVRGGIC